MKKLIKLIQNSFINSSFLEHGEEKTPAESIDDYLLANGVTIRRERPRGIGPIRIATNADRIRAMSDEELAWLLMEFWFAGFGKAQGVTGALPDTIKGILKLLQQPVVQNNTDCGCSNCANLGNNSIC